MTNLIIVNVTVAVEVPGNYTATPERCATTRVRNALTGYEWFSIPEEGTIDPIATEAAKDPPHESMADEEAGA